MKIGDVVCLVSGGPNMTLTNRDASNNEWWCVWFNSSEGSIWELKSGRFPEEVLKIIYN